jgi:YhcH/YjgK/YiaL family protein
MIIDSLKNASRYEGLNPRFKQAFDFLNATDLTKLTPGKIELDGKNLFVNVSEMTGKTAETAGMETHEAYIDIQVPVSGTEIIGWIAGSSLKQPLEAYNPEKDIAFWDAKATNFINVQPSEFAIFFPEDGHQPGIVEGQHKKIIVKVLI